MLHKQKWIFLRIRSIESDDIDRNYGLVHKERHQRTGDTLLWLNIFFLHILSNSSIFYMVIIQTLLSYEKRNVAQQADHVRRFIYIEGTEKWFFGLIGGYYACENKY